MHCWRRPDHHHCDRRVMLKRSPFKTCSAPGLSTKKPMKNSKGPRMTPIRKSARGEECTLRLHGVCNFDTSTTVLCHENGAGAGMKSLDQAGAYGCYACHMVLDGHVPRPDWLSRDSVLESFKKANALTRNILIKKGLI